MQNKLITDSDNNAIEKIRGVIPEYVIKASEVILGNGQECYLVGGAVRDLLLMRDPKDYDLATNALPEEVSQFFQKSVNINAKFGTILALIDDAKGETHDVEITTYRLEAEYFGSRWPSKVEFAGTITEDLSRRDLTINAIALNMAKLFEQGVQVEDVIVDPYGGLKDLRDGIVRAVGVAVDRYTEDGLRAFKTCRIASELSFEIEDQTFEAIKSCTNIAKEISIERIRDEFDKLLKYSPKPSVGIELMRRSNLLAIFLPELLACIGVNQPEWHSDDVYTHSLKTLDLAEDEIKLAALLHDIGKPRTISQDDAGTHFYSHDVVGAEMTKEILARLRYPKQVVNEVANLVRWHMFYYPSAEFRKGENANIDGGWSDAAIRRFIIKIGGVEVLSPLFKLRLADANSNEKANYDSSELNLLQDRVSRVLAEDSALKISDLDITGEDLIEIGIDKGPKLGQALRYLLENVLDNPSNNMKHILIKLAKDKFLQ